MASNVLNSRTVSFIRAAVGKNSKIKKNNTKFKNQKNNTKIKKHKNNFFLI